MRKSVVHSACALALAATAAHAQATSPPRPPEFIPRLSPKASTSQTIGMTEIALTYGRPSVKGRTIWGELVPYGEVWRAGANENTTIRFSTPVKVQNKDLPAGTYGLHTIPGPEEWTVIFSKDFDSWGSFEYRPEDDALRVQVKPRPAEFQEQLQFEIVGQSDSAGEVVMRWERLAVPFKIEADTPGLVIAKARETLGARHLFQVASYCLQIGTCLQEGERWIEASIDLEPNFFNYRLKARLLVKRNDMAGAVAAAEKALTLAKQMEQPPPPSAVADLEKSLAEWRKEKAR